MRCWPPIAKAAAAARISASRSSQTARYKSGRAKRVVAQAQDSATEISLAEAQQLEPHAALGQQIEVESPEIFNKIPAQTAKQIILQRIREAELEHLFESYRDLKDDLVVGVVLRQERPGGGSYLLDLGKIEGVLDEKEQIPDERLRPASACASTSIELKRGGGRGVQALVSRTHRNIIKRLLRARGARDFRGACGDQGDCA